jgi:fatty acid desaturase
MLRLLVPLITFLANSLFLVQTFIPLLKRQWFWDAGHELHFSVSWQWLGFEFAKDDVVVKYNAEMHRRCAEAMANGEYQTLETVIAEMKAKSRKPNS